MLRVEEREESGVGEGRWSWHSDAENSRCYSYSLPIPTPETHACARAQKHARAHQRNTWKDCAQAHADRRFVQTKRLKIISHEAWWSKQAKQQHAYLPQFVQRWNELCCRHVHAPAKSHGEASHVSIFSHCASVSLSACRPASCNTEGEKYAFVGRPRKTQDAALSFSFTLHCVILILLFQPARQNVGMLGNVCN